MKKTMDEQYGDGSKHECCPECGFCIPCGDCATYGCGAKALKAMLEEMDDGPTCPTCGLVADEDCECDANDPPHSKYNVPEYTLQALRRYVDHGIPPGGFLQAVLSNDLKESFSRADEANRAALYEIVRYVYWEVPSLAWGSRDAIAKWIHHKGWEEFHKSYDECGNRRK